MTVVESDPQTGVTFDLWMAGAAPFHGKFEFEKVQGGTKVTWTDWGDMGNPFFAWFTLIMDSALGDKYLESGLADLKQVVETPAEAAGSDDG